MRVILTGGIGSGKSTAASWFRNHGATIIDYDQLSHRLTGPGGDAMPAIVAMFGADAQLADGGLNRQTMRRAALVDANVRIKLESILHPLIRQQALRMDDQAGGGLVIHDIPLYAEGNRHGNFLSPARVLVIDCPPERQVAHCLARGGMTIEQINMMISIQALREQRLALADDVVVNAGTLTDFHDALAKLIKIWDIDSAVQA
jgi:dephospho-CoA kinase